MTTAIMQVEQTVTAIDRQMDTARSLRASAHTPLTEVPSKVMEMCESLDEPATQEWIMARIATLLTHFYVSPLGETQMRAVAADWHSVLKGFPAWAIQAACVDWLSGNIGNGKKPTPPGIAARVRYHHSVVPFMRQKAERATA